MGTISNARAVTGLFATGTPTGTNVAGKVTVGVSQVATDFTDADIAYSFLVTATGGSDVATLTLSSGSVAQTTGTPTITDGDGNDFEGVTIPTAVAIYAIMFEVLVNTTSISITSTSADLPDIPSIPGPAGACKFLFTYPTLTQSTLGTIALGFNASTDSIRVTVIGSTTS